MQKRAAELLGINPTTLNEMIKRHEIGTRRRKLGPGDADVAGSSRLQSSLPATEVADD